MPRKWNFQLPTQIEFGRGCVRRLGTMVKPFGGSALLVGYADRTGMEQAYTRAARALADCDIEVHEFFEVLPDPDVALIEKGAVVASEARAEMVIGFGGGSVIDAAKGIATLAEMGGCLWDYMPINPDSRAVAAALPIIAVPTTAGSGAEVTAVAVFTHYAAEGRLAQTAPASSSRTCLKASIVGPAIRPKLALVDPDLASGSPARLTAACGADALGHAIEACMSRNDNPIATTLATRAATLIFENLPLAVDNPEDPKPREPLALAATLAGSAFDSAGVTVAHSIAHALGSILHIPHGEAVSIATPPSLRFNTENSPHAPFSADRVAELFGRVGLPDRAEAAPGAVADNASQDLAERLAENAIVSTPVPIKLNPRKITREQLVGLIKEML